MEMILLIFLTFVGIGSSLENMCLNYADEKSLQAVSFCSNGTLISNKTIVLSAYKPGFTFGSTLCMCQLNVLSNQSTSKVYIKENIDLIPSADCGLAVTLKNVTHDIRNITCTDYVDEEYSLLKESSMVLTLTNTSVNFSNGFCFALSLRFETSPISINCFSPGITTIPTPPTPALETTTSGYVSQTVTTTTTSITSATTSISTKMPPSQSSEVPYWTSTESFETTSNVFTDLSSSSSLTQESDTTTSNPSTVNDQTITTTGETVSSTKTDSATPVTSNVRDKSEFNVLYVIVPVLGILLIGIFCLVAIWYKRQYNTKRNIYRQERLQSSVPSSVDTDHIRHTKRYGDTLHTYDTTNGMKEEPSFFYYEDQHIRKPVSDIYAKPMKKTEENNKAGLYVSKNKNREVVRKNTDRDEKKPTTSSTGPRNPNLVYVSVNGGERFVL